MTLDISDLTARYGRTPVLHGIDLHVADREILAVLGPSGSGKTTLLRAIAGLHPPRSGRIVLGGVDVTDLRPEHRRVGLVPQEGALFGHLSVAANVGYGLRARRSPGARDRVTALLRLVDLDGLQDRMPHQLSGGQRQRVALARALAPEPRIVLLDEPFSGLDAALRVEVRSQVVAAIRESGATAVLITHDQDEALSVGDRVAVLHDGVLAQTATPDDLYDRPVSAWIAAFVGRAALLPGTSDGTEIGTALGPLPHPPRAGGPALAVVRPEQVHLAAPGNGRRTATVRGVDFLGHARLVRLELADGTAVSARVPAAAPWRVGAAVGVWLPDPVHVVPVPPAA